MKAKTLVWEDGPTESQAECGPFRFKVVCMNNFVRPWIAVCQGLGAYGFWTEKDLRTAEDAKAKCQDKLQSVLDAIADTTPAAPAKAAPAPMYDGVDAPGFCAELPKENAL